MIFHMHRSNGIINNNIIVDSLIETFHHLSRQLISNSLHFFFQCCILMIRLWILLWILLLLWTRSVYYSTFDIDRYLWEQRRVHCSHTYPQFHYSPRCDEANVWLEFITTAYYILRFDPIEIYKASGYVIS